MARAGWPPLHLCKGSFGWLWGKCKDIPAGRKECVGQQFCWSIPQVGNGAFWLNQGSALGFDAGSKDLCTPCPTGTGAVGVLLSAPCIQMSCPILHLPAQVFFPVSMAPLQAQHSKERKKRRELLVDAVECLDLTGSKKGGKWCGLFCIQSLGPVGIGTAAGKTLSWCCCRGGRLAPS